MYFFRSIGRILGAFLGLWAGSMIGVMMNVILDPVAGPLVGPLPLLLPLLAALAGVPAGIYLASRRKWGTIAGLLLGLIFVGSAIPSFCCSTDKAKVSSVKANMHALQVGIEQYAEDHQGKYPDSVIDRGFNWSIYVPNSPKNPYNQSIQGAATMEPDVKITSPDKDSVYRIAHSYSNIGRAGYMRYFVDARNHSTYAIIGYSGDAVREFFDMGKPKRFKGKIIKETMGEGTYNFVLHR